MTVNTPQARGRVEILDLLRAVAVVSVVMCHYGFRGTCPDENFTALAIPALAPYAKYGYFGVQMFFVISGFVIAYSAEQRTALQFAIARVARIYPGFVFCMTVTFIVTLAIGGTHFQTNVAQWLGNTIIASPAMRQPFMDGAYWSLVYEIIFYTWVAGLMMAGWFRRRIDLLIIVWMAVAVLNRELHSAVLHRLFLTDESGFFAAGLVLYEMYCGRRDTTIKLLLALATVIAVGQSFELTQWGRVHCLVPYDDRVSAVLSVTVIAAVGLSLLVRRVPLPAKLVTAIGGITYPLYLLHQNIGYMVFNYVGDWGGAVSAFVLACLTAAGITVLAWATWRYIERPGQRLLKRVLTALAAHFTDMIAARRLRYRRGS